MVLNVGLRNCAVFAQCTRQQRVRYADSSTHRVYRDEAAQYVGTKLLLQGWYLTVNC